MPNLADLSLGPQRRRTVHRTVHRINGRITCTVPVAAAMAILLTACGGDGTTADHRRPSAGAVAAPAVPPSAPGDRTDAQAGGAATSFADLFGPPTDRLDDAPTTAPTAPPTVPPTVPPTAPPTAPPMVPPTVPPGAMTVARMPVAPIAPDFDRFRTDIDELHTVLVDNDATLARLDLSADRWTSRLSITILDGSVRAAPIDGGVIGTLLDVDGSVAGAIVHGDAERVQVLTAVVTLVVELAADSELDAIAARWDEAASADVTETVVPAADGGFWTVSSTGGFVTLIKMQDASPDWIAENGPLFFAETLLAMPPG